MDDELVDKVREVVSPILMRAEQLHPSFHGYCGHLIERQRLRTYIRYIMGILDLGRCNIKGAVVLDAGCGFGITCIVLAMLGAKEVHGVEIRDDWASTFKKYLSELPPNLGVYSRQGDVAKLDYPSEFFDVAISIEAISHYRNVAGFLHETHRVLKRGGALLVSDGNNGANPYRVFRTREIWRRFEEGPPTIVHGHQLTRPYRVMRLEIIRQELPRITEAQLQSLSAGTFGMNRAEVIEACKKYRETGILPNIFWSRRESPLDPELDMLHENLFDPRKLAEEMKHYGLHAKAYGYFGGATGNPILRLANKILPKFSPLTLYFAPTFRIVAVKQD